MIRKLLYILLVVIATTPCQGVCQDSHPWSLHVSQNGRFLVKENDTPFFWLGDTGWLLFSKLNRQEAEKYLEDRRLKGFNVIQVMVLHTLDEINVYGDTALVNSDISHPLTTPGTGVSDPAQYDFWDHVDYIIDLAAKKGLYMAMVPVWGSNVKSGRVSTRQVERYASFLAGRYAGKPNIIWLNGGDIRGSDKKEVWETLGKTLKEKDKNHLISFHPFGRTSSSDWFHNAAWLDFNMFQSGHRRYDQDTSRNEKRHFGEDNWRYVVADYNLRPVKPTLDGEPSYEGIPQGLHDTLQPRWKAADVRRYAYWSVFSGGFGFTYGNNSVMQFHNPKDKTSSYGSHTFWYDALNDPGARQMVYLKELMLSRSFLARVPDQSMIADQGDRYNYLAATRGENYALVYSFNGRTIKVTLGKTQGKMVKASWFNPRNGKYTPIGSYKNQGTVTFNPPGEQANGNDWVLIVDSR